MREVYNTVLNYTHFLDEKMKLQSALLHACTGDASPEASALCQFILNSSTSIYIQEIQDLMKKENGLCMNVYKTQVDQLEAGH